MADKTIFDSHAERGEATRACSVSLASAYLGALVILCLLAPGLKKVEPNT
jgi:hypothetical protein